MKAAKKPIIIDYFPIENWDFGSITKLKQWILDFGDKLDDHLVVEGNETKIKTLEGNSYSFNGDDVIIRGVKGEYYPCKKYIFKETYDIINTK